MARHTAIDCYAKRGRRGYLFVIGDEMAYPQVKSAEVRGVVGGGLQAPLPLPALIDEVTARVGHLLHPPGDPVSGCHPARDWPEVFEEMLGAPVVLRSYGPTAAAKRGLQATPTLPRQF
jgi:hypothetical protein